MYINLTHLKYFFDAVTHKSISAAARENFVSQSAISQGILKLENALQVNLTMHQKQKFRLTEEGNIVFREAKSLFSVVGGLKDKLNAFKDEISGEIKFACTNSLAQFYLPPAYLKMKKIYPQVCLKFHRGNLNYIHESLNKEKVDFALVLDSPEFEGYERKSISQGYFRLYKHKDVNEDSGIIVDHLENYEVIELRERHKERYGKDIEILDTLSGWALVFTFVQLKHGIGYLPEFVVKDNKDLVEVELDITPIKYSICMLKLKSLPMTRAESAFLNILRDVHPIKCLI